MTVDTIVGVGPFSAKLAVHRAMAVAVLGGG